jgi:anti-anti-sigma regulatory factor/putative methionine-R-sulfoxide reductase with GAF domain
MVQVKDLPRVTPVLPDLFKGLAVLMGIMALAAVGPAAEARVPGYWRLIGASLLMLAVIFGLHKLHRRGYVTETVNGLIVAIVLYITVAMPLGFIVAGPALVFYAVPIVAAGGLLSPAASWVYALFATLTMLARVLWVIKADVVIVAPGVLVAGVLALNVMALLEWWLGRSRRRVEKTLRKQLKLSRTGIEIGHMVTEAFNPTAIMHQAVQSVQQAFGYYHVGIFTRDADRAMLIDAAGEQAADLKAQEIALSLDSPKAVAVAIDKKQRQVLYTWAENVDDAGRFLAFTYPELKSRVELVIPLQVGERVLGALDIHRQDVEAFSEEDFHILEGLAGNIANTLDAALLFEQREQASKALELAYAEVEQEIAERTAELEQEVQERERLQQEIIEAQRNAILELSVPIIPVMDRIIVLPLIGNIDAQRARDITRTLLAGISEHRAKVVILDVTGMPMIDTESAVYLNKTIQAARLKGARTIITGITDAVAETLVDLGIDWRKVMTLRDLQTGLLMALRDLGWQLSHELFEARS